MTYLCVGCIIFQGLSDNPLTKFLKEKTPDQKWDRTILIKSGENCPVSVLTSQWKESGTANKGIGH